MQRISARVFSTRNIVVGTGLCATTGLIYALEKSVVNAGDVVVHPFKLKWPHSGFNQTLDYNSVRRGYEVYKQVCAACHSMQLLYYRHFVDVFMTEKEAKDEAADALIEDINDNGEKYLRPGRLTDKLPKPYPNKKAAAAANNGSEPPDLNLITLGRHGGDDYIFALLTSYFDPPAGIKVEEGKAYNPYFLNNIIAMPQQLFDEGIEYKDGTPATQTQQAKDIVSFLHWASEPYHDTRKLYGIKMIMILPILLAVVLYGKRYTWSAIHSQKFAWRTVKGREPQSPLKSK